jgi:peroxiredoxin
MNIMKRRISMKKQAGIWIVVTCLMLVAGIVYALSMNPPSGSAGDALLSPGEAPQAAVPPQVAAAPSAQPAVSLSPNLSRTDAYALIDPIPVGHAAPDFSARMADGKPIRLSGFKGKKNLVIVFYQGSFCTVCGEQLTNLQSRLSDFKKQDAEIIAISADDAAHAQQSVGEHGLTFPVVPDQEKAIIKRFGVANVSRQGIAWPSLFVVDKRGLVRLSYADRDGHRLHSDEILPVLVKVTGKPLP